MRGCYDDRRHSIERIVDNYAEEAIAVLGVASSCFTTEDRARILRRALRPEHSW